RIRGRASGLTPGPRPRSRFAAPASPAAAWRSRDPPNATRSRPFRPETESRVGFQRWPGVGGKWYQDGITPRAPIFIGSAFVAKYPEGGGNFWVPLQYLLGLRALGIEAYWLELVWGQGDEAWARRALGRFRVTVSRLGVA